MSFCVDLWGSYDTLFGSFTSNRKGLRDLIHMFKDIYDVEMEYTKNLQKVVEAKHNITLYPQLSNAIASFKCDIQNQVKYHIDFAKCINEEIIQSAAQFYETQSELGKSMNTSVKLAEKNFYDEFTKLEGHKAKFHGSAKEAELGKLQFELKKFNKQFKGAELAKQEKIIQTSLKESKECERMYVSSIKSVNQLRETYNNMMKSVYLKLQNSEEEYISFVKDSLRKYIVYQVALTRSMQYDVERKAAVMEGINVKSDIDDLINKLKPQAENNFFTLPIQKIEFTPYQSVIIVPSVLIKEKELVSNQLPKKSSSLPSILANFELTDLSENEHKTQRIKISSRVSKSNMEAIEVDTSLSVDQSEKNADSFFQEDKSEKPEIIKEKELISEDVHASVKNFFKNIFFSSLPDFDMDSSLSKSFEEIKSLVEMSWEGKALANDEISLLKSYLSEYKFRKHFGRCLNKIRYDGLFGLSVQGFECLGSILFLALDEIHEKLDFETLSTICSFSQAFYRIATEANKPRMFLYTYTMSHKIWSDQFIWEGLIKFSVNDELLEQKSLNTHIFESKEEKELKKIKIAMSQVTTVVYGMINLKLSKNMIKSLIGYFVEYYTLGNDKAGELLSIIEST